MAVIAGVLHISLRWAKVLSVLFHVNSLKFLSIYRRKGDYMSIATNRMKPVSLTTTSWPLTRSI